MSARLAKGLSAALVVIAALLAMLWFSFTSEQRAVLLDPPTDRDVLFWSQDQRDATFRALDAFPALAGANPIAVGDDVRPLPNGEPLDLGDFDLDAFLAKQRNAAMVVVLDGEVVLERYGLDFGPDGKWTSFSVAKSLTSTLVGAALQDGAIESLDDPVERYVTDLAGSAYDGVTIRQVLTMSSGVEWREDYTDPTSDIARFNEHVPTEGMDATVSYLRQKGRAAEPGERWHYNTLETNLIGVIVSEATGKKLADYMSEKVWQPFGMQQDASWLLGLSGHEIAGCCIQAATRDMARFGMFVLAEGVVDGERVVPEGWFAEASTKAFDTNRGGRGYGYQWWTYDDGAFAAGGIFGQGIFIDPNRNLVIASNGNWPKPRDDEGRMDDRNRFYERVQQAVDERRARDSAGSTRQ